MTRDQLIALRSCVSLAEDRIRQMRRNKNRLEWTQLLRRAWQATLEVSLDWVKRNPGGTVHL